MLRLEPGADQAAAALAEQISDTYLECADQTRYVLVGYSQGAWAIGKALRGNLAPGPINQSVQDRVAAILLVGDPAWPANEQPHPNRSGVATRWGRRPLSAPYAPAEFAARFTSVCVSFDGGVYDPICWHDGDFGHLRDQLYAHSAYKNSPDYFSGLLAPALAR